MLDNYQNYNSTDFLEDDHFIKWRIGQNEEISRWWSDWLENHPEKKETVQKAIEQYNLLVGFTRIMATAEQQESGWSHIEQHIDHPPPVRSKTRFLYWVAAAAVIAAIGVSAVFLYDRLTIREVLISSGDKNKSILLPDSSFISLNKASSLKYRSNNEREMWLDGSAYFVVKKIRHNKQHIPFIVHAGNLDIEVLGTTFSIVNTQRQCVAVLKEGAIQATAFSKTKRLSPGEKINVHSGDFTVSSVNADLYNPWTEGSFHFDNTNMDELADIIAVFYGRELIVKDRSKLKTKSISGIVAANDTTTFIKTLEILLNANIDLKEKEIIISPK